MKRNNTSTTINLHNVPEYTGTLYVSDMKQDMWHILSEYGNEAFARKFIEAKIIKTIILKFL